MQKPNVMSQLQSNMGLARAGGMMSRGSMPSVMNGPGRGFAAMENAMLKNMAPNPMKLAKGKKTRQFKTMATKSQGV